MTTQPNHTFVGRDTRAFSLLEVLMVMAIMGIAAAVAAPRYAGYLARTRVSAAITRIKADIESAKADAKHSGQSKTIAFDMANERYSVGGWQSMKRSGDSYTVQLTEEPYGAVIVIADFGGAANLVFDGYGEPASEGYVTVSVGQYSQTLTVGSSLNGVIALPSDIAIN